jgi:cytochrome b6-f complex iron-sulfur subunit
LPDSSKSAAKPPVKSRRRFVIGGVGAAAAATGYFIFRKEWVEVGPPDSVPASGVLHFEHEGRGAFLMRDGGGDIYVLSQKCAHQGCDVDWKPDPAQFQCPCHAGVYSVTGARVSGAPIRGLATLSTRINEAGMLEIKI